MAEENANMNTESQEQNAQEQNTDNTPTVEELQAKLEELVAKNAKNKLALDKALKEKGDITKALRAKQTAEEQAEAEQQEARRLQEEKYNETLNELNHIKAVSAYKNISEKTVETLIEAVSESDHANIAKIIENEIKQAVVEAKAEWMKSRPRVNAGGEYSGMTKDDIMKIADRTERRKAIASNPELFNN